MPDVTGKGTETGKFTGGYCTRSTLKIKKAIQPSDQIEKLSVYAYPYGTVETKDTSKYLKLWTNTNIKAYSYLAYAPKNKGIFSGSLNGMVHQKKLPDFRCEQKYW